jgi:hypothetical protein
MSVSVAARFAPLLSSARSTAIEWDLLLQQPDGDAGADTPGVAAAPVALAGAIMPGVARFIVTLSAHADVFGVGATVIVGSMLVPPSSVITG